VVADNAAADQRLLYLHGGGYVICSFQLFAPILPEGQQAIERIGAFIRAHMS
jgi:acetyl esterase/lipase